MQCLLRELHYIGSGVTLSLDQSFLFAGASQGLSLLYMTVAQTE